MSWGMYRQRRTCGNEGLQFPRHGPHHALHIGSLANGRADARLSKLHRVDESRGSGDPEKF